MHIQRQFERARLKLVIYRLLFGNRRSRNEVVMYHMGRQCGTRVRPLSALMFPNKSRACVKSADLKFGNNQVFDMTPFGESSRRVTEANAGWPLSIPHSRLTSPARCGSVHR